MANDLSEFKGDGTPFRGNVQPLRSQRHYEGASRNSVSGDRVANRYNAVRPEHSGAGEPVYGGRELRISSQHIGSKSVSCRTAGNQDRAHKPGPMVVRVATI